MARTYGNDNGNPGSAEQQFKQELEHEAARKDQIGKIVVIAAIAFAAILVIFNIVRCVTSVSDVASITAKQTETQAELKKLQEKLQDPDQQNMEYKESVVGNMGQLGQEIADAQNDMIAARPPMTSQSDTVLHDNTTAESAVSDPSSVNVFDSAIDSADLPSSDEADDAIVDIANSDSEASSDALDAGSSDDTNLSASSSEYAELVNDFQKKYVKTVANAEGVTWSWYGVWSFDASYDFSASLKKSMKAVWTCYDSSDVSRLKPLAFVTATYSADSNKFSNFSAMYMNGYIKKSEAQAENFGGDNTAIQAGFDENGNPVDADGNPIETDTEGSDQDTQLNEISDDASVSNDSVSDNSLDNNSSDESDTVGNDTAEAYNPSGVASWAPGSGSVTSSGTSNASGTAGWVANGTASSGTSTGTGTWSPKK